MMSKLAEEFGNLNREDFSQIHYLNVGNGNAITAPSQRFEMQLLRIGEMAARIYEMYCEVWRCQQKDISPGFLSAVSSNGIGMLISARTGSFIFELGLEHKRTGRPDSQWLKAATQSFKRNTELLLGEWQRIAEIDGKTLEYMLAGAPSNPVACEIATQIVHARTQLRILDTRIASLKARIRMSELALSAMQTRPPDAYRMKSIEQMHGRLIAEKGQCENRRDQWQGKLDAAMSRSTARLDREALEQDGMIKPASASGQKNVTRAHTAHIGARSGLNYRSELKNVIALNFAKNHKASDLDICRALDSDGAVELPTSWQTGENRLFERAYKNPQTRRKVEITISKVRNQMRKKGLLD